MIPDNAACPECGETPTDESIQRERLSDLGYHHEDTTFECSNGHTWTCGIPVGTIDTDMWVCPCCEGDLIPHFITANPGEERIAVRPKCRDCYYLPNKPIEIDSYAVGGTHIRGLIGHHAVTGEREGADVDAF